MKQAVEQRAAVVAKCGRRVRVRAHLVLAVWRVRVDARIGARTAERDELVAPFVHDERAYLTLKALTAEAPDEIFAVAAKCGLLEEALYELVILHLDDVLLTQGASPSELFRVEEVAGRVRVAAGSGANAAAALRGEWRR